MIRDFESISPQLNSIQVKLKKHFLKNGWLALEDLTEVSAKELLRIPGVGPTAIYRLRKILRDNGLDLKE